MCILVNVSKGGFFLRGNVLNVVGTYVIIPRIANLKKSVN